jgi:RNA polymerase sigma factor (sigma-70 family)
MELILENTLFENGDAAVSPDADVVSALPLMDVFLKDLGLLKCIVAGMGFNRKDAEDILQDVSVAVLRRQPERMQRDAALRWLKRVTVNKCISEYRRRERFQRNARIVHQRRQPDEQCEAAPEQALIRNEKRERLRQALKTLAESLLVPLLLRFFCDQNASEIARILDIKPSSVRSRLRKARMMLADTLIRGETEK